MNLIPENQRIMKTYNASLSSNLIFDQGDIKTESSFIYLQKQPIRNQIQIFKNFNKNVSEI